MAEPKSLALTCKKDDRIIFHTKGKVIGSIIIARGRSSIAFTFPEGIDIDRESLFKKKYPSLALHGGDKTE